MKRERARSGTRGAAALGPAPGDRSGRGPRAAKPGKRGAPSGLTARVQGGAAESRGSAVDGHGSQRGVAGRGASHAAGGGHAGRAAGGQAGGGLSHYAAGGGVRMVDVSAKPPTYREAEARAFVALRPAVLAALERNPKGDPLEIARIAGIAGAKRTAELIPLCHTLPLSRIQVEARRARGGVRLTSRVGTTAATGVEMEALTAVSIAALTLYDMCKALDHGITIRDVELTRKSGGLSGDFRRPPRGKRLRRRA